jgi:hypothetical protein
MKSDKRSFLHIKIEEKFQKRRRKLSATAEQYLTRLRPTSTENITNI